MIGKSIKLSDMELDAIGADYRNYSRKLSKTFKPFSQYFKEVIEAIKTK